jgi:hypothetical protein
MLLLPCADDLILRGFVFEGSDFDRSVLRVTAFVLPLYLPTDTVHMTFGFRLGGPANFWTFADVDEDVAMDSIREYARDEGMPFLKRAGTPGGFADWLTEHKADSRNLDVHEALAYSLVLDGRPGEALRSLEKARNGIAEAEAKRRDLGLDPTRTKARSERVQAVEQALATSPTQAADLLRQWAGESAARLGLERAAQGDSR